MTRVAVIGNAGGGKSTMCRALGFAQGLPYFPIDLIQWKPGWVPVSNDLFISEHEKMLAQNKWIIDGFGPWQCVEKRFDQADTIIFIDLPLWIHFWWAAKRQVKSVIWGRDDGPEGCPMLPATFRLFRMMWQVHTQLRPRLIEAIAHRKNTAAIIHIRSVKELADFRKAYC